MVVVTLLNDIKAFKAELMGPTQISNDPAADRAIIERPHEDGVKALRVERERLEYAVGKSDLATTAVASRVFGSQLWNGLYGSENIMISCAQDSALRCRHCTRFLLRLSEQSSSTQHSGLTLICKRETSCHLTSTVAHLGPSSH